MRVCTYEQFCMSLRCLHSRSIGADEGLDQNLDLPPALLDTLLEAFAHRNLVCWQICTGNGYGHIEMGLLPKVSERVIN